MDGETARSCRYLEDLCHGMQAVRKPLLAAVNGHAVSCCPPICTHMAKRDLQTQLISTQSRSPPSLNL